MISILIFIVTSLITFIALYKLWNNLIDKAIANGYIDTLKKLHISNDDDETTQSTKSALSVIVYFIFMVLGRIMLFVIAVISIFFGLFIKDLLK